MKEIKLPDGRVIRYELTRKPVANINFRIKADGIVRVSASSRVTVGYIEKLLAQRADYIFSAAERLGERESRGELNLSKVNWLGKEYPVRIIRSSREFAVLDETEMRVFTIRGDDSEYLFELIRRTVADSFAALCTELNEQVRRELRESGLTPPPTRITIKDMKSRWGSCSYNKGHISINSRLAAYPRETVLSVLWHEYAHYWHHDHSPAFYAFLERHFPEYHQWNDKLKF